MLITTQDAVMHGSGLLRLLELLGLGISFLEFGIWFLGFGKGLLELLLELGIWFLRFGIFWLEFVIVVS